MRRLPGIYRIDGAESVGNEGKPERELRREFIGLMEQNQVSVGNEGKPERELRPERSEWWVTIPSHEWEMRENPKGN